MESNYEPAADALGETLPAALGGGNEPVPPRWGQNTTAVRAALKWIKARGGHVTAEELVTWDGLHGQKLFPWTETEAASLWRVHAARLFLNTFRRQFEGMRVRGFINIRADVDADIEESAYVAVEAISQHEGMRAQVIADITKRMATLASELRMWSLSDEERAAVLTRLAAAM